MKTIIEQFDQYLAKRGFHFRAVIIGGAALNVMGVIQRFTKDVDCLSPVIPCEIQQAAQDFRTENPSLRLWEKWLNNGPISLANDLTEGWEDRLTTIFEGAAVHFLTLGRLDLLMTKLFALCDRQQDIEDCIALSPTADELDQCLEWLYDRDGNPFWPDNVRLSLEKLAKEIGYDYRPAR